MRRILHENLYSLSSYDYVLPPENIAQFPASPRDSSRLLVWQVREGRVDTSQHFRDIVNFLRPDDLLILNDTRVIPARLAGTRETGGKCEVFLLRNITPDFLEWEALVKPARKLHKGSVIQIHDVKAEIIADGVHVSDEALKLFFKSKPEDKVILISDSLPITYSSIQETTFADSKIYYNGKTATSANGTIAGSTKLLPEIIKILAQKRREC